METGSFSNEIDHARIAENCARNRSGRNPRPSSEALMAGLSKPNCFSSSLMKADRAPAHHDSSRCIARAAALGRRADIAAATAMRLEPLASCPCNCAMMRSTGPPGANWMMVKTERMPSRVGTISASRRSV